VYWGIVITVVVLGVSLNTCCYKQVTVRIRVRRLSCLLEKDGQLYAIGGVRILYAAYCTPRGGGALLSAQPNCISHNQEVVLLRRVQQSLTNRDVECPWLSADAVATTVFHSLCLLLGDVPNQGGVFLWHAVVTAALTLFTSQPPRDRDCSVCLFVCGLGDPGFETRQGPTSFLFRKSRPTLVLAY
jgi:hypothetical protein